jgi:chorismate mutase
LNELEKLRIEIDSIDNELLKVLGRRFAITRKIGEIKRLNKFATTDESRLHQILHNWRTLADQYMLNQEMAESILLSLHGFVIKEHEKEIPAFNISPKVG